MQRTPDNGTHLGKYYMMLAVMVVICYMGAYKCGLLM